MAVTFSVVIPTYGRPGPLTECLDSIYRQSYPPMEVIVVGVEGDLATREAIERFRGKDAARFTACELKFLVSPHRSLTTQRNMGIREARGGLVCFFDDDCVPGLNYLSAMAQFYEANMQLNIVGMVGLIYGHGNVSWRYDTISGILYRMTGFYRMSVLLKRWTCQDGRFAILHPQYFGLRNPVRVLWMCGCSVYNRSFLAQEMTDTFFQGYSLGEDYELSIRALKYGNLYYVPQAQVTHKHVALARESVFSVGRQQIVNLLYIYRKHFRIYRWRGLRVLISIILYSLMVSAVSLVRKPWEFSRLQRIAGIMWGVLFGIVVRPSRSQRQAIEKGVA